MAKRLPKNVTIVWRWLQLTGVYGMVGTVAERPGWSVELLRVSTDPERWTVRCLVDGVCISGHLPDFMVACRYRAFDACHDGAEWLMHGTLHGAPLAETA